MANEHEWSSLGGTDGGNDGVNHGSPSSPGSVGGFFDMEQKKVEWEQKKTELTSFAQGVMLAVRSRVAAAQGGYAMPRFRSESEDVREEEKPADLYCTCSEDAELSEEEIRQKMQTNLRLAEEELEKFEAEKRKRQQAAQKEGTTAVGRLRGEFMKRLKFIDEKDRSEVGGLLH
jgi:hypothetical protein